MKTIRISLVLVSLVAAGCATGTTMHGYYRYPDGITNQCHLKIDDHTVSLVSLEQKRLFWSHPYKRVGDAIVVAQLKETLELTPGEMSVTDQRNRAYARVTDPDTLQKLEGIIRSPNKRVVQPR